MGIYKQPTIYNCGGGFKPSFDECLIKNVNTSIVRDYTFTKIYKSDELKILFGSLWGYIDVNEMATGSNKLFDIDDIVLMSDVSFPFNGGAFWVNNDGTPLNIITQYSIKKNGEVDLFKPTSTSGNKTFFSSAIICAIE